MMARVILNDWTLAAIAGLSGVLMMFLLFRVGLLRSCAGCHVNVDTMFLDRHVQCKSIVDNDIGRRLGEIMSPYLGGNTPATDWRLVSAIRDHFIDYPRPFLTKFSQPMKPTPQAEELDAVLHGKVIYTKENDAKYMYHSFPNLKLFHDHIHNKLFLDDWRHSLFDLLTGNSIYI